MVHQAPIPRRSPFDSKYPSPSSLSSSHHCYQSHTQTFYSYLIFFQLYAHFPWPHFIPKFYSLLSPPFFCKLGSFFLSYLYHFHFFFVEKNLVKKAIFNQWVGTCWSPDVLGLNYIQMNFLVHVYIYIKLHSFIRGSP